MRKKFPRYKHGENTGKLVAFEVALVHWILANNDTQWELLLSKNDNQLFSITLQRQVAAYASAKTSGNLCQYVRNETYDHITNAISFQF